MEMENDFFKPGEGVDFNYTETDYDILEKSLLKTITISEVYRKVAMWIWSRLKPSYIFICTAQEKTGNQTHISGLRVGNAEDIASLLKERTLANMPETQTFVHKTNTISLPYLQGNGETGFIFLGHLKTKLPYTHEQIREVLPVLRILNKALLSCETYRVTSERERLQDAFSRYVAPDIVQGIMADTYKLRLGGEKKFLSCIFTDIEGFTSMCDGIDPGRVVKILNIYLNEMSQVIISLGGVIDKFEGDAIMAFFGAPHELPDHALRCCLAALRMKRMESVLNDQLLSAGLITKPLITRIGVNTGDMVIGNIGSLQRLDFTVIGRNVNIASRLENANKKFDTSILISRETYNLVKDYFDCNRIGLVHLRGIEAAIETFELCGQKEGVNLNYNYLNTIAAYNNSSEEEELADELEEI